MKRAAGKKVSEVLTGIITELDNGLETKSNKDKNSFNNYLHRDGLKIVKRLGLLTVLGSTTFSLATAGAANYLVNQITRPHPVNFLDSYTFSPFELQIDYEEISFPTANGTRLKGWFFPRPGTDRVVLGLNGYRGRKEDMLGITSYLWRAGYNSMVFDYRGHGMERTREDVLTLGHRELEDLEAAIRYVKGRFKEPQIGLVGGSMGASVSIIAAARDESIKAVWSDSAFASQQAVIANGWFTLTHLPTWPVINLAEKIFKLRTGHNWKEFEPVKEIGKIGPRPVYIVHSSSDSVAPVKDAYALYGAAKGPKELWIEDDLEHCGVYFSNREEYSRRVLAFFDQNLAAVTEIPFARAV